MRREIMQALLLTLVAVIVPVGINADEQDAGSGPLISVPVIPEVYVPVDIASTGDILRQFTPTGPTGNGRGMAFDGTSLYYTIVGNTNIFKTDMFGNLTATIPTPVIIGVGQPQGGPLAWDGMNLWTINYGTDGNLVQLNTSGGLVSTCNIFTANPGHPAITPASKINFEDGLDWTGIPGSELVLSGEAFAGNSVIFLNTSCGIQSWFTPLVKSGFGTSGVAFDGVNLWHAYPLSSQAFQTNVTGGETGPNFSTAPLQLEDLAYDTVTFAPKCALWGNNAAGTNQLTAYEVPCGIVPPSFTIKKDFRFTDVNFTRQPAMLGDLLPDADADGKFDVRYVTKPKDGTVSSTNPGQLYGVITANGSGADMVDITDTFGTQFDVNPDKLGGGVEVIRVDSTGNATVLTGTTQVTSASVDNAGNMVDLTIDLDTPLAADEKLVVYIKFQTALKGMTPDFTDFENSADVVINSGASQTAAATIEFV